MGSWSPSPISQNTARALLSMREEYTFNKSFKKSFKKSL